MSLVAWIIEGAEDVPFEVVVIVVIIVLNAVLGYVQEARAEQAVAALQRMAAATATVVRDGAQHQVPSVDVVPGDVLLLAEGDAVAADGRLIEAASLMVAEASLTGESEAVLKDVTPLAEPAGIGDRVNMVFDGTAVTRGRGRAVVTATGMGTEMGNVARLLDETEEERTPLQREVDLIGRMLGIAVIVIAIVVVAAILLTPISRRRVTSSTCSSSASRWRSLPCPRGCRRCCRSCSLWACSGWLVNGRWSRSSRPWKRSGPHRSSAPTRPAH